MEVTYRLITKQHLDHLLKFVDQSIDICSNCESTNFDDPHQDPQRTYAGAVGYARGTLRMLADDLRNLPDAYI